MAYYDHTQPLVLQTDISEYGLGTALLQDNKPIAFASKMLTDVETRYANMEKECLSVCFGFEKFHTCLWQMYDSAEQAQVSRDDPEEAHTCSTAKTSMHVTQGYKNMTIQSNIYQVKIWSWQTGYQGSLPEKNNTPVEFHQSIQTLHFN